MDTTSVKKTRQQIYKEYRDRNPEKVKEAQKKWRDKNKEKIREKNSITNRSRSKEDHSAYMREWRKRKPDLAKNADLKKSYGITLKKYNEILESQGGVCIVCESPPGGRKLSVDHCHNTGKIRGILCSGCNTSLGLLGESKERILALAEYIGMHGVPTQEN